MARVLLFVLVIGVIFFAGFSFARRPASSRPPRGDLEVTGPVEKGITVRLVPGPSAGDPRLGPFLRQAIVFAESWRAEYGTYPTDVRKVDLQRPANVALYITRVGEEGLRMSAINSRTDIQCDAFVGDSARWAFGYAFDPRVPACGKVR